MSHSSVSKKLETEAGATRSPIEEIARIQIAVPAIHDVCHPRLDVNPNIHGDKNRNPPSDRLITSMKASIFRLSVNMVTSHDQGHARKLYSRSSRTFQRFSYLASAEIPSALM